MALGSLLLVEDEILLRTLLKRRLASLGWRVTAVESGRAALDVVKQGGVSLVLSDVNMPGLSGLDLCAAVRARGLGPPVVLMSGLADAAMHGAAQEQGAAALLSKPLGDADFARLAVEAQRGGGVAAR